VADTEHGIELMVFGRMVGSKHSVCIDGQASYIKNGLRLDEAHDQATIPCCRESLTLWQAARETGCLDVRELPGSTTAKSATAIATSFRPRARHVRRPDIGITSGTPVSRNGGRPECEVRPFQGRICMR